MDKLKYRFFYRLWHVWHCRLPWFKPFMKFVPKESYGFLPNGRELAEPAHYRHWESISNGSRPWWHMCCNGNCGGWRTGVCDYLEGNWRSTKFYERGEIK